MKTTEMTIKQLANEDKSKVLTDTLARIKEVEPKLNAFVTVFEGEAKKEAEKENKDFFASHTPGEDSGQARMTDSAKDGHLQGIPVGIKDVLCTRNLRTTASAKMLDNFVPPYDATVVKRLRDAGAIIVGKNNCDAWAHGASTENSDYGVTPNPWDMTRVSGGSSGGSAAAVAAGEIPYSIGTDTGGSIRQPASFCGVVGLKPTYGRVSRYGLIAMASSLDCPGPITRTVEDAAIVMNVIAGPDPKDATTLKNLSVSHTPGEKNPTHQESDSKRINFDYVKGLNKDIKGLKVGVPKEYFGLGLDKEVEEVFRNSLKVYEKLGAEVVDISLPHTEYGVATYYIIQTAEVSSNLGRYDGVKYGYSAKDSKDLIDSYFKTRDEGFGDEAKRRIMLGTYVLSSGYYDAYYLKAAKVRRLIHDDFVAAFKKVDVIMTPTAPTPAFKIGEKGDPLSMYLADVFTAPASLAGVPAISIPAGFSSGELEQDLNIDSRLRGNDKDGSGNDKEGESGSKRLNPLPIGIQIIGPHFEESEIMNVAHKFEKATEEAEWRRYKTKI